jgi:hypothetical protein
MLSVFVRFWITLLFARRQRAYHTSQYYHASRGNQVSNDLLNPFSVTCLMLQNWKYSCQLRSATDHINKHLNITLSFTMLRAILQIWFVAGDCCVYRLRLPSNIRAFLEPHIRICSETQIRCLSPMWAFRLSDKSEHQERSQTLNSPRIFESILIMWPFSSFLRVIEVIL